MQILGIDYGRKKIGLAISGESGIAEPLSVVRMNDIDSALDVLGKIISARGIEKIVVGDPGGKIGKEVKKFVVVLNKKINLPIELQDETLSTSEAINLSIAAGIKRKKRKAMEDAYAATLILQSWIDKKI